VPEFPIRLTAGGEGEQVAEVEGHGLFTKVLIDVLQEMLKNQTPLTVMAPKLYEAIRPRVLSENQHPEFGQLENLRGHVLF
jgi:hypothetical protein